MDAIAQEKGIDPDKIEIWFADEPSVRHSRALRALEPLAHSARIGHKYKIMRRWARSGTRPSAPSDQCTVLTYIFGATCPSEGKGTAPILPFCNTEAMNLHIAEIAR